MAETSQRRRQPTVADGAPQLTRRENTATNGPSTSVPSGRSGTTRQRSAHLGRSPARPASSYSTFSSKGTTAGTPWKRPLADGGGFWQPDTPGAAECRRAVGAPAHPAIADEGIGCAPPQLLRGEAHEPRRIPFGRGRRSQLMSKSSHSKVTSRTVAKKASKALQDGRSSTRTRSIAGSALAQARGKKRGK